MAFAERDPNTGLEATTSIVQRVRECVDDVRARNREFYDFIGENISFGLDQEHYEDDASYRSRNLNNIRPRDPSLFRVWSYTVGLFQERFPVHIEARPNRNSIGADLEAIEGVKRQVEAWAEDEDTMYDLVREEVVGGALCGAAWAAELQYSALCGLVPVGLDPRRFGWAAGYRHPHHKHNPWVVSWARVPLPELRLRYGAKVPEWLRGDDGATVNQVAAQGRADNLNTQGTGGSPTERDEKSELVTVAVWRARYQSERVRKNDPAERQLDPKLRHMACAACGWTSPPQAEMASPLPEQDVCPECGQPTTRVDAVPGKKYSKGKRLVICAPYSGMDVPFYDDSWEFDYPTFPVMWFTAYTFPHKIVGQSRTSILKTPTLITDAMYVIAYQTLLKSRPYYAMPEEGVNNYLGQRFGFTDDDADVMYYSREYTSNPVQVVQGVPFNEQVLSILDRQHALFREVEDTSQTTLDPEQLSKAKVGALEQQAKSGNVTLDHQGRRFYREETRFMRCVAQAFAELPEEDVRYRDKTGTWAFQTVGGPSSPSADLVVGSGYSLEQLDAEDIQAYQMLRAMPPEDRRAYVTLAHLDPSILGLVEQADAEAQQRMAQQQEQAAMASAMQNFNRVAGAPGAPQMGQQGGAAGAPQMNGSGFNG